MSSPLTLYLLRIILIVGRVNLCFVPIYDDVFVESTYVLVESTRNGVRESVCSILQTVQQYRLYQRFWSAFIAGELER